MRCCPYVYIYIWSMGEVSGAILWRRGFLFGMAEGGTGRRARAGDVKNPR